MRRVSTKGVPWFGLAVDGYAFYDVDDVPLAWLPAGQAERCEPLFPSEDVWELVDQNGLRWDRCECASVLTVRRLAPQATRAADLWRDFIALIWAVVIVVVLTAGAPSARAWLLWVDPLSLAVGLTLSPLAGLGRDERSYPRSAPYARLKGRRAEVSAYRQ